MNPQNPNPSSTDSTTPSVDLAAQNAAQNAPAAAPPTLRKNYFELRLRIRYWWMWTVLALLLVLYPIAVIYTAFSRQSYEASGPQAKYQKQWEDTGCVAILQEQTKTEQMEDWEVKRDWKHLLRLDNSYLAWNDKSILDEPFCLGARMRKLVQTPGPWRYDIVDSKTKIIIVSITPKK
jgi:hypothetical protein